MPAQRPPRFTVVLPALALVTQAAAADLRLSCHPACELHLSGQIQPGDAAAFQSLAHSRPITAAVVSGPGGAVLPALAIGRAIRAAGLPTRVPAGASCASACALIWLAGTERFLGENATIGFHATRMVRPDGSGTETHASDGKLTDYLTELGYSLDVTATIVDTPSSLIHWRDATELNANGIPTRSAPAGE